MGVTLSNTDLWGSWSTILITRVLMVSELLMLNAVKWRSHFLLKERAELFNVAAKQGRSQHVGCRDVPPTATPDV
jgi:hypothetical protein